MPNTNQPCHLQVDTMGLPCRLRPRSTATRSLRMLKAQAVNSTSLYKITIWGNHRLSLRKTLFVRITRSTSPLMICLCTLRFYVDVPTPSTNFIGFIEFYDAIFHAVAVVFHCLLILMRLVRRSVKLSAFKASVQNYEVRE